MSGVKVRQRDGQWQIDFTLTVEGKRRRVRQNLPGLSPDSTDAEIERVASAFYEEHLASARVLNAAHTLDAAGYDLPRKQGDISFDELADLWMERMEVQHSAGGTLRRKRSVMDNHLRPKWKGHSLSDLTPAKLEAWKLALLTTKKKVGSGTLSPTSVNVILADLGTMLTWAVKTELLARNPMSAVDPVPAAGRTIHYYEIEQRDAIIKAAVRHRPGWAPLIKTGFGSGMRPGELLGLLRTDADLQEDFVLVARTHSSTGLGPTKGRRERLLPLTQMAREGIEEGLDVGLQMGSRVVFCGRDGGRRTVWRLGEAWKVITAAAEKESGLTIPTYSPKSMRHTFASLLVQAGAPLKHVSELLGHRSVATTEKYYAHLAPKSLIATARIYDRLAAPAGTRLERKTQRAG